MPTQPTAPDPTPARPPVRSTAWWKRHGPLRRRPRVDVTGINGRTGAIAPVGEAHPPH